RLIVANTHLYFHPHAAHIRLMQLVALVDRISILKKGLIAQGLRPAVVLGGDLNSPPSGPVRYLMGEVIGPDSDLWSNVGTFKWGDRFFDEVAATPDKAAVAAAVTATATDRQSGRTATTPAPPPGGNGTTTTTTKNSIHDRRTSDQTRTAPSDGASGGGGGGGGASKRRPCLPGVPYLRSPLDLNLASGTPAFTNFTPDFTETLDYVFVDGGKGEGKAHARKRAAEAVLAVEASGGEGSSSTAG
ncbi:unnamed protein product, partial [Hapterophycus canaliculatus]